MATDGASIGEVYVDVLPKSDNFFARFQAQTRAQASRAGDELGGVIGKSISDHIAKGIRDGLSNNARADATRAGQQSGTAYAAAFKQRVEAGLRGLSDVKIGLDSSKVNRDITQLRTQLERLRSRDLTVSVDVTAAYIDVVTLRDELAALGRQRPTVRPDVDTAAAMARVQALIAEVEALGRLSPTVRPDVDDSSVRSVGDAARDSAGSVSWLAAAGVALGPAIVPSAAAAAAAIAGITPMAIAAAGGLAVTALAVSGVVGAVKAMSAADDQAAQSTVSLAGNQSRLASASDAVRSAQASLANATANAADSQRRASQAIVNADRAETDAHRTLAQAQQAVTQARVDAARAAQDLSSRVAHNAADQEQAALDITKAEESLAQARQNAAAANTPGNNRAVREAEIALTQQRLRVQDLQTEHQRLAEDKQQSDRVGIDGSTQVVSALDRVRQATEQVHKAEQATAEARAAYTAQARQSAASIAQAQQGVINAQRSLEAATVSSATAGGAAMLKLQQTMADLSPAGQQFATFLYGLRPVLIGLRQTAEGGLLPGFEQGIRAVLPTLPAITEYTRRFSSEVGQLAAAAGRAFATPYWQDFARLLVDRAIPALDTAALVTYNFGLAASGLIKASLPLGQDFGGGLLRFSQQLAAHALTLENSRGYRDFLAYVREIGPQVAHTIGEVVTAAVRLVEAIGPLGGVSLTAIRLVAQAINALPVPVLTVLAGAIGLVVLQTKALAIWATIGPVVAGAVNGIAIAFRGFQFISAGVMFAAQTAMTTAAAGGANAFGRMFAGIRAGAVNAGSSIAGLAGAIGPGGILGIALAAGTIAILAFAHAHEQARVKEAQHKSNVTELTDAIKQNSGAIDDNVRKIAAKQAYDDGALDAAKKAGVSVGEVTNAYIQGGGALSDLISQQESYIESEQKAAGTDREHQTTHLANIKNSRELIAVLEGRQEAANENETATRAMAEADRAATGVAYEQTPVQKALGEALRKLADDTASAADKANALRTADESMFSAARNAIVAEQDAALAQINLAKAMEQSAQAGLTGKAALDLNSEAGIRNRQTIEQRLTQLNNQYFADVASGMSAEDAGKKHDNATRELEESARTAHWDADEVNRLVRVFGTIPTNPKAVVTVSGVTEALTQLQNLEIAQLALKMGIDPAEATRQYKKQRNQANSLLGAGGLAAGGPVFGPGGPTDDKIPVWLSNGEHVITAAEVQAAGGHSAIEAIRKFILGGRSPQTRYPGDGSAGLAFANGGPVQWPFPTTAAMTRIPSMAEVRRIALFGPEFAGTVTAGLEAAQAFVRNQAGKPYIWASAGPYGYDCSGIVSAAWNIAHGRNPYNHTFSTMNEAPYFPLPGYGPFTAGWSNPGERGPGGDSVGHTAAKIGNMAFESIGGQGVRIGSSVTPIGSFAHVGHYDSGGPLPPGLTIAYNGTGQNEQVYTADDHARAQSALAGGGDGRLFRDLNVHGSDGMSVDELTHRVLGEIAWQMR